MHSMFRKIAKSIGQFIPFGLLIVMATLLLETNGVGTFLMTLLLLMVGLLSFEIGTMEANSKIASLIAKKLVIKRNLVLLIGSALILGICLALLEPNTWILGNFILGYIKEPIFIISVSIGLAVTLLIGLLRIVFNVSIKSVFIVLYISMIMMALIVSIRNPLMVLIAFDAGGIVPGLIVVPFLIGLGTGIGKVRSDKNAKSDSFGMVGIVTLGPIIALLIVGLFYQVEHVSLTPMSMVEYFFLYASIAGIVLIVCIGLFTIFNYKKLPKKTLLKKYISFGYTYIGIVLVLTAINGGLIEFSTDLGLSFRNNTYLPIFLVLLAGAIILVEPSIKVLIAHVEDMTAGVIHKQFMWGTILLSWVLSLLIISVRIYFNVPIWWFVIIGYGLAIILALLSKEIFLSIAFDAGGASSGLLTVGFILPFFLGVSDSLEMAFGNVLIIQLIPLLVIQTFGLIKRKEIEGMPIGGIDNIIDI